MFLNSLAWGKGVWGARRAAARLHPRPSACGKPVWGFPQRVASWLSLPASVSEVDIAVPLVRPPYPRLPRIATAIAHAAATATTMPTAGTGLAAPLVPAPVRAVGIASAWAASYA